MSEWTVIARPVRHDDVTGIAVLLTDGDDEHEVGRVAFVRQQSKNPGKAFEEQFDTIMMKADNAAEAVNDLVSELDRMQAIAQAEAQQREDEAAKAARKRIREALGSPGKVKKME